MEPGDTEGRHRATQELSKVIQPYLLGMGACYLAIALAFVFAGALLGMPYFPGDSATSRSDGDEDYDARNFAGESARYQPSLSPRMPGRCNNPPAYAY